MNAVAIMHSRGVLRNGIDQDDLQFDRNFNPTLTDFALSRPIDIGSVTGLERRSYRKAGDAYFAAHELLSSRYSTDFCGFTTTEGDVYATAAVMFQALNTRD